MRVLSLDGKVILKRSFSEKQWIELNVEALSSGLYFINLDLDGKKSIHKLLKN